MRNKYGRFTKGHIPWHKGKHLPKWYKEILSKAKKGKKQSKETRKKRSESMKGKFKGSKHPCWKGGKMTKKGYIFIKVYNHPCSNRHNYIREHRLVMEKHLGRYLSLNERVHHINHIKTDNRIKNLMLFPNNSSHIKFCEPFKRRK